MTDMHNVFVHSKRFYTQDLVFRDTGNVLFHSFAFNLEHYSDLRNIAPAIAVPDFGYQN